MGNFEEGSVFDGRYTILGKLGAGGMATVYKVRRDDLDGPVALKILSEEFLARNPREAERNLRRFKREADILRLLEGSRHVVGLVDHGCSDSGDWFITMELLEGEQLRYYVGRGKNAMGVSTFMNLAEEILQGLAKIHAKGIIHRDLAPDNIIVVKDATKLLPKFLDFGIGKSITGELDQVTQMVTIMGKPHYFSPEQARGQEQTAASDVYSLGVILYEMLTGHVPLRIRGVPDFRKIQRDPPEPIGDHPEAQRVPEALQGLIMSCLAKKPEDRPSLEAMLEGIREVSDRLNAGDITATIQSTPDTVPATVAMDLSEIQEVSDITLKSGETISRFEIRSILGRGGMGAVYLAWDPTLQREVAIKVATKVEEEAAKKAILREARASSALRSENIVTIYDAGTDEGTPYIAMEFVSGPTLSEVIEDKGALIGRDFWDVARAITTGLKEAHERENPVIHRDLKPGNILLGKNATKITDFGIATVATSATKAGDTGAHGATAGTAATMSPEQAEGQPSDHRSDIYSLGCVLYMMATGHGPFTGNAIAVLYQHCTSAPTPPSKANPQLEPAGLDPIILKCLEKAPDTRYQSASAVLDDLRVLFKDTETVRIAWYRSRVGIATMVLLLVAISVTSWVIATRKEAQGPTVFGFELADLAGQGYDPNNREIWVRDASLHIKGQAEDDNADQLEVIFSKADGSESWTGKIGFINEGELEGTVKIPRELLANEKYGRLKVGLRVEGDEEDPKEIFDLVFDEIAPRIRWRNRGSDWITFDTNSTQALRYDDVEFEITDEGHGFQLGKKDLGRIRASEGMTFSEAGVSITTQGRQFIVQGKDQAGNPLSGFLFINLTAPGIVPGFTGKLRTKESDIEFQVTVQSGKIDLRHERLTRLAAVLGGDEDGATFFTHKAGDVYVASFALPADVDPGVVNYPVTVMYDKKAIPFAGDATVTIVHDTQPPVITLKNLKGGGSWVKAPDIPAQRFERTADVFNFLKIEVHDHGKNGSLGANLMLDVVFEVEGKRSEPTSIRLPGPVSLPANLPPGETPFRVILLARDEALNETELSFNLTVSGSRILPLASTGAKPHGDTLYVSAADSLELRVEAGGLPSGARLFVEVGPGTNGAPQRTRHEMVKVGSTNAWAARDLPALADKKSKAFIYDTPDQAPQFLPIFEYDLVQDRTRPAVTPVIRDLGRTWRTDQRLGHFPHVVITIEDDIGIDQAGTNVTCTPPVPGMTREYKGKSLIVSFPSVEDGSAAGPFEISVQAQDLAGNPADPWTGSFEVVPPDITVWKLNGKSVDQSGSYENVPLYLTKPLLRVSVGNNKKVANFRVQAQMTPKTGEPTLSEAKALTQDTPGNHTLTLPGSEGEIQMRYAEVLEGDPVTDWKTFETIRYVVDQSQPEIVVLRDGVRVPSTTLREGFAITTLAGIRIEVNDDLGLPNDPLSQNGSNANDLGLQVESKAQKRVVYQFSKRDSWDTITLKLRAGDLAGNTNSLTQCTIARALDTPVLRRLTTTAGKIVPLGAGPETMREGTFRVTVEDAKDVLGVKIQISRKGLEDQPALVDLKQDGDGLPWHGDVNLSADGTWELAFSFQKGKEAWEPLKTQEITLDTTAPSITFVNKGAPVTGSVTFDTPRRNLSLQVEDALSGLRGVTCRATGRGAATNLELARGRSGQYVVPLASFQPATYEIEVTAVDNAGNTDTESLRVTIKAPVLDVATIKRRTGVTFVTLRDGSIKVGSPPLMMSRTEITIGQFKRFHTAWARDPAGMVERARQEIRTPRIRSARDLQKADGPIAKAWTFFKNEDPDLPMSRITGDVALLYCWWAGGRLPTLDEWRQAAGWAHMPECEWPAYRREGTWSSNRSFLVGDASWGNFRRGGRGDKPRHVSKLEPKSPFGLVGIAGNVAEYVTSGRGAPGTMGGSYLFTAGDEVSGAKMGRDPRPRPRTLIRCKDAGIRLVLDPRGR